ncbi:MAG: hypothetical protein PHP08_00280 [Candidatus Dojkabacteria bacterium]|nr:hypothetical protein [Candidatus Dojkabacteria bacterium]
MEEITIKEKIIQLKCEIFDIIRQQEILNNQINQLQNLKSQKVQELQKLEQLKN